MGGAREQDWWLLDRSPEQERQLGQNLALHGMPSIRPHSNSHSFVRSLLALVATLALTNMT
jgi:hypothetical protein